MRILCFLHSFEPGGVERMALRLCRAWRDEACEVALVMGRDEGVLRSEAEAAGLSYRTLPSPGFPTGAFETLWMLIWLPGIVRRERPDILFCAGNSYAIIAVLLKLLLGRRCPPIVAKVSNDLARPDMIRPVRLVYHLWCRIQGRAIDQFVALSAGMRGEAAAILGVRLARIRVIADPILTRQNVADFAAAGEASRQTARDGQGRRYLAIGRLAPQKDFPLLLRAFRRGGAPADRLVILGEGRQRRRLERMIRTLGLTGRVALGGHSSRIRDWIGRCDVFLLSSRYEGLPAVLVEAMAAGLPVIATDCCRSMTDVLTDPRRSRLVPPGDEQGLAHAIATSRLLGAPAAPGFTRGFEQAPVARTYLSLFGQCGGRPARLVADLASSPV